MSVPQGFNEPALAAGRTRQGGMAPGFSSLSTSCSGFVVQDPHSSQHGEGLTVPHDSTGSGDLSQEITKQRAGLGIMVFSSARKVLYANQAAYQFIKALNHVENGHATHGALPVAIADLFDQILKSIESRIATRDYEQLEAKRLLAGQDQAVILQAFGLSDRLGMQRSRVVITMQGAFRSSDASPTSSPN